MDYIRTEQNGQLRIEFSKDFFKISSLLFNGSLTVEYKKKYLQALYNLIFLCQIFRFWVDNRIIKVFEGLAK